MDMKLLRAFALMLRMDECILKEVWISFWEIIWVSLVVPGVSGGEPALVQSSPARMVDLSSISQPSFTPFMLSMKNEVLGVGKTPELMGGLLTLLPEIDSGGVAG